VEVAVALTDNLRAYWKLDDSASASAADAHASFTLTQAFGVGTTTGKINSARSFPSNSVLYDPTSTNFRPGDADFTIALWANATTLNTSMLTGKDDSSSVREYGLYYVSGTSRWTWVASANGTSVTTLPANNAGAASTSTWYHIVAWHDSVNDQIGIAVNAGTPDTTAHTGGIALTASLFTIGANSNAGTDWDGALDEYGWWDRVLTSGERTSLYNGGAGLAYPLTVAGATARQRLTLLGVA
jgi:hypothetical protein